MNICGLLLLQSWNTLSFDMEIFTKWLIVKFWLSFVTFILTTLETIIYIMLPCGQVSMIKCSISYSVVKVLVSFWYRIRWMYMYKLVKSSNTSLFLTFQTFRKFPAKFFWLFFTNSIYPPTSSSSVLFL